MFFVAYVVSCGGFTLVYNQVNCVFQGNTSAWCNYQPYRWLSATAPAQPKTRPTPTQPTMHCSTSRSWRRKCDMLDQHTQPYSTQHLMDVIVMILILPVLFIPVLLVKLPSQRQLTTLRLSPQISDTCPCLTFTLHSFNLYFPELCLAWYGKGLENTKHVLTFL